MFEVEVGKDIVVEFPDEFLEKDGQPGKSVRNLITAQIRQGIEEAVQGGSQDS